MVYIPKSVIEKLNELSCEEVAEKLGIVVKHHRALCIAHDDHHPSMGFFGENRNRWYCFACHNSGNAIKFVETELNLSFVKACEWLCSQFGIYLENVPRRSKTLVIPKRIIKKPVEKEKIFVTEVAQYILNHCNLTATGKKFLFDERKLNPTVIKSLNIVSLDEPWELLKKLKDSFPQETLIKSGFISQTLYLSIFTPCLIIPYYDVDCNLVGLQTRYLGTADKKVPRFQFISSQKTKLYNLPVLNTLERGDDLYISEGITDCLALLSAGKKALAIPSSTILPKLDLMMLDKFRLHMYPDNDDAGRKAYEQLQRFFINLCVFLRCEKLPLEVSDYSEYYKNNYATGKE